MKHPRNHWATRRRADQTTIAHLCVCPNVNCQCVAVVRVPNSMPIIEKACDDCERGRHVIQMEEMA